MEWLVFDGKWIFQNFRLRFTDELHFNGTLCKIEGEY
jgi:hypothetical protein